MATRRSLEEALRESVQILAEAGVPTPRVDAEQLAAHVLDLPVGRMRALALTGAEEPDGLRDLVAERARRIPLQHLTGTAWFRHVRLQVGPGVFIPRPETESVAQLAIDRLLALAAAGERPRAVDLGTGSGAIAASLAQEVPDAEVWAVELNPLAHAWAARNLQPYHVHLVLDDLRGALADQPAAFDVVVSNPPYIPSGAVPVDAEVAEHDPQDALYGGGEDGMIMPRATVAAAERLLRPGGWFVMEHAEVQADAVARLLNGDGWTEVELHRDLNGRERATSGVWRAAKTTAAAAAREGEV